MIYIYFLLFIPLQITKPESPDTLTYVPMQVSYFLYCANTVFVPVMQYVCGCLVHQYLKYQSFYCFRGK